MIFILLPIIAGFIHSLVLLQVYVPVTFSKLHLTLMPRYGNPDLLANVAGGRPSISTYQYASTVFIGTDMVDVDANSVIVRSACKRVNRPGALCPPIRVAVYGNDYSAFTLLASLDGRTLPLTSGYPLILSGTPNVYTFFTFNASTVKAGNGTAAASGSATASVSPSITGSGTCTPAAAAAGGNSSGTGSATGSASVSGTRTPFPSVSPLPVTSPAAAGSEVVFTLTALSGMPVIYVSSTSSGSTRPQEGAAFCAAYDTATAAVTSSTSSGANVVGRITIRPGDACYCGNLPVCTYYVGVGSEFDFTYYTVLATENPISTASSGVSSQPTFLLDGLPQDGQLAARGAAAYLFEFIPAGTASSGSRAVVTLSLSQYFGAVTLYASFLPSGISPAAAAAAPVPGAANGFHYRAVTVGGSATISVPLTDPTYVRYCGSPGNATSLCVLAVGVTSGPTSGYALVARSGNKGTVLNDGNPALAQVPANLPGAAAYFRYTQTDPGDVIISAVPISGAVDIYVGSSAFPGTSAPGPGLNAAGTGNASVWRSLASNTGAVTAVVILQDDPRSLACAIPCTYSVGIVPSRAAAAASDGSGTDASTTSLAFTVMARTRTTVAVPLLDGQPLIDYVGGFDYDYYVASLPAEADSVTVSVQLDPSGGGGAIVPASAQRVQLFARADGALPDPSFYQYASPLLRVTGQDASMTIRRTDPAIAAACPPTIDPATNATVARDCEIALLAMSPAASGAVFTVTSVAGSRVLSDGAAVTGTVAAASGPNAAGNFLYYTFVAAGGSSHVQLTLTGLAGSPVGYVSTTNQKPNATSYEYRLGSIYGNTLTLRSDGCGDAGSEAGQLCAFYITIASLYPGNAAVFRLQGSSSSLSGLSLGSPASGKAGPDGYTFFSLYVPPPPADGIGANTSTGVRVVLQALDGGWLTAFVSNAIDSASGQTIVPAPTCGVAVTAPATGGNSSGASSRQCVYLWPLNSTYQWAGRPVSPYVTSLRLAPTDKAYATGTTYVIAVTAALPDSDFTITAVSYDQPLTLASGTPVTDTVGGPAGSGIPSSLTYRVLVPAGATSVTLQAVPQDGDVSVFASLNTSTPAAAAVTSDASVFTAGVYESHRLVIPATALSGCTPDEYSGLCSLYVTVAPSGYASATSSVTYSLSATSSGVSVAPSRLLPGAVQAGALPAGAWAYYYVPINVTAGSTWYINHIQLSGTAAVYVTTDGSTPSPTNYAATASSLLGVTFLSIRPENPAYISSGAAIVGVRGLSPCSYTLSQGSPAQVEGLLQGVPLQGRLDPGQYSYYSLAVGSAPGDIQLGITALSGAPLLFASRWDRPAANLDFRPSKDSYQWAGLGANVLTISPGDPAYCAGCIYSIAVYCDPTIIGASSGVAPRCSFIISGTTGNGGLTRLIDGVPVRSRAPAGQPRYFSFAAPRGPASLTLVAAESSGSSQILLADRYVPSGGSPGLPAPAAKTSFNASSVLGIPRLGWTQRDPVPLDAASAGLHLYTIGVSSAGTGAAVFNLRASSSVAVNGSSSSSGGAVSNPVLLLPGSPSNGNILSGVGSTQYFAVDIADTTRDVIFSLGTQYGSAQLLVGSRGSTPACTLSSSPSSNPLNCSGAMWSLSTGSAGTARLRISARSPCAGSVAPDRCIPGFDWAVGTVLVAVVATTPSVSFSLTSFSSSGLVLLEDGQPLSILQSSDGDPQVLAYSINGDPSLPDVRLTWDADASSAAFRWYLTSCIDGACSTRLQYPSPTNALASNIVDAGRRVDSVIGRSGPHAAAYCRANSSDVLCNYYIVVIPVVEDCAARGISPCLASFTLTASFQGSLAPIQLDAGTLAGKVTVLSNTVVPNRDQLYYLFVSGRGNVNSSVANTFVLRLEACDTLLGYPAAYLCEDGSTGTPGTAVGSSGNASARCVDPTRPDWRTNNYAYALDTQPAAFGGDGRSRLTLTSSSNTLYMSVGNPDIRASSWERKSRWLPSTYEMSVTVGDAVRLRPDPKGGITAVQTNTTELTLTWPAPLVTNLDPDSPLPPNLVNVSSALSGVTYKVYIAKGGFTRSVATITNTTLQFVGAVYTTACGLDRWGALVSKNISVLTSAEPRIVVSGLAIGAYYEVNVVAVCNDDCLRSHAARLNLTIPSSGLATLRMPYVPINGSFIKPAPSPLPIGLVESADDPTSLISVGFLAVAAAALCVCVINRRYTKKLRGAAEAKRLATSPRAGLAAAAAAAGGSNSRASASVVIDEAAIAVPRTPSLRRAVTNSGANPAAAASGAGVVMPPAAVEAASYNTYAQLAARLEGANSSSSISSGAAAAVDVTATGSSGSEGGNSSSGNADPWASQGAAAPGGSVGGAEASQGPQSASSAGGSPGLSWP